MIPNFDNTYSVVFAYTPNDAAITGTLLKWGEPEFVEKYFNRTKQIFIENNLKDFADELRIAHKVPGKLVTKFIEHTGSIGKWFTEETKVI